MVLGSMSTPSGYDTREGTKKRRWAGFARRDVRVPFPTITITTITTTLLTFSQLEYIQTVFPPSLKEFPMIDKQLDKAINDAWCQSRASLKKLRPIYCKVSL